MKRSPATGEIEEATLRIYYWSPDAPDGEFSAFYERRNNGVSITSTSLWSGGYVIVEPRRLRGSGFGTYLMNISVTWAKQWPWGKRPGSGATQRRRT